MKLVPSICLLAFLAPAAHGGNWTLTRSTPLPTPAEGLVLTKGVFQESGLSLKIEMVWATFDSKAFDFRVVDRPDKLSPRLGGTMQKESLDALVGVNGGYFGKVFEPLGWVVADGKEVSKATRAKLLSGVLFVGARRSQLLRMGEIKANETPVQALQAGPFLVDRSIAVAGLNNDRRASRTFVATDGKTGWMLGVLLNPTLAEAGSLLATPGLFPNMKIQRALNFDGGRSTGFWARQPDESAPIYIEEISEVRNFLALIPRKP